MSIKRKNILYKYLSCGVAMLNWDSESKIGLNDVVSIYLFFKYKVMRFLEKII